jgi:LDH2 family malate/lactate/ureidoglycolate dehydrogenase
MFSALLAQASYSESFGFPNKGEAEHTGFTRVLIDVAKFMPTVQFKNAVNAYIRNIKASRKAKDVIEILMSEELEFKRYEQFFKAGYEVSVTLGTEL